MTTLSIVFSSGRNFSSNSFIVFSINLPNIALFLNLAFCFIDFATYFLASLCNFVIRSIYGFKNCSCLKFNILLFFFNCSPKLKIKFQALIVEFLFSFIAYIRNKFFIFTNRKIIIFYDL